MKKFHAVLTAAALLAAGNAIAADFNLDRGIGYKRGNDIEDWVSTDDSRAASVLRDSYTDKTGFSSGSSLATALGNSISVQMAPNSHIMLNASQINLGNQNAEVQLKSLESTKYKNVETPSYNIRTHLPE